MLYVCDAPIQQVVNSKYRMAFRKKRVDHMRAEKSRCTCYECSYPVPPHGWNQPRRETSIHRATDADVGQTHFSHCIAIKHVASIEDDRIRKPMLDFTKVQLGELSPVGKHYKSIRTIHDFICILGEGNAALRQYSRRIFHRSRIIGGNDATIGYQGAHNVHSRGFP